MVRLLDAIPAVAPRSHVEVLNHYLYISNPAEKGAVPHLTRLLRAIDSRSTDYPWGRTGHKTPRAEFLERQQLTIRVIERIRKTAA